MLYILTLSHLIDDINLSRLLNLDIMLKHMWKFEEKLENPNRNDTLFRENLWGLKR